jgi:hypothetical protein
MVAPVPLKAMVGKGGWQAGVEPTRPKVTLSLKLPGVLGAKVTLTWTPPSTGMIAPWGMTAKALVPFEIPIWALTSPTLVTMNGRLVWLPKGTEPKLRLALSTESSTQAGAEEEELPLEPLLVLPDEPPVVPLPVLPEEPPVDPEEPPDVLRPLLAVPVLEELPVVPGPLLLPLEPLVEDDEWLDSPEEPLTLLLCPVLLPLAVALWLPLPLALLPTEPGEHGVPSELQ